MTPRSEQWPKELRDAWARLTPAEERLMLRARWKWRGWVNPSVTPPGPPQGRETLRRVTELLYALEFQYRQESHCPGAYDAAAFHQRTAREVGRTALVTVADLRTLLTAHPDGLTFAEIREALPDMHPEVISSRLHKWKKYGKATMTDEKPARWTLLQEEPC